MKVWGIHMGEKVGSSPLDKNYIGIGWRLLGDLRKYANSRDQLKGVPESFRQMLHN